MNIDPPTSPGETLMVAGSTLIRLPAYTDSRGTLVVADGPPELPFDVKRAFLVFDVPAGEVRGAHGHRTQHEVLIAAAGSVTVEISDGRQEATIELDSPTLALHLPPRVIATQRNFSRGACLVVLASGTFDEHDYFTSFADLQSIRDEV
jgi:UDP-2-acetamido-3-amino-2,3-dideoxy-glucuronate N-acetyltransferase